MVQKVCALFIAVEAFRLFLTWPVNCPADDICNLAGQNIRVEGQVVSTPSVRLEGTMLEVVAIKPQNGLIQVVLPHTQYNLFYGDQVILNGKLKLPGKNEKDNFSYPLYLAGKGIYAVMYYPEVVKSQRAESFSFQTVLYKRILALRERIRLTVNNFLAEPSASVVNAMLIGDQGMVSNELRSEFSESGIIHILSVSGAHVTLVIFILVYLAGIITSRKWAVFLAVLSGVSFYLLLSGAPDCAVRAGIMGLLAFLALQKGRLACIKTLFWLSGAILVYFNPFALISDIGFQLSYLAVFGMIYLFPLLDKVICWGREGLFWKIFKIILLSFSIAIAISPLVLYYFGILSVISPIANLVLLPLFSILLPLSFILISIGFLANLAGFMNILTGIVAYFIQLIFQVIQDIVKLFLKIPGSYFSGNIEIGWLLLFYLFLIGLAILLKYIVKNVVIPRQLGYFSSPEFLESSKKPTFLRKKLKDSRKTIIKVFNQIAETNFNKLCFAAWLLIIGLLLLMSVNYLYSSSRSAHLVMLNVDQGDSFLLDWPKYHFQILIDGGPGRNILPELGNTLPFYDRKIELLVLTHPHQDHLEGLMTIREKYGVSKILLPSLPQANSAELFKILWNRLSQDKISISVSARGQKILFSANEAKVTELEFLTPFFDCSKNKIIDFNDQSAAIKVDYPKKILFMGDSSKKVEGVLLAKESHNLQAEILKIGHHGSRFSTSDKFLDLVKPETALISAGKDNLFGHPAKETLKKLEERGIEILRTDKDNRIEVLL